jgi:AraC family transcriptional regulator
VLRGWDVRVDRLPAMRAAYVHSSGENPEEDAWRKMEAWAEPLGLLREDSGTRVFGRNTYPTAEAEPHGYEFYLSVGPEVEPSGEIGIDAIPGGRYAVLGFQGLENIAEAWRRMWDWIEGSKHEYAGWQRGEHGWIDGFEENLTPLEKDPEKWAFDLWVKLKE